MVARLVLLLALAIACNTSTPPPAIDARVDGSGPVSQCPHPITLMCQDANHLALWYCGAEAPANVCSCANGCVQTSGSATCAAGSGSGSGSGSCF